MDRELTIVFMLVLNVMSFLRLYIANWLFSGFYLNLYKFEDYIFLVLEMFVNLIAIVLIKLLTC